ncbi:MAG: hypothetical protein IPO93_16075 [Actinobacteria bacterium]|nr:hypothetical protein [Actinomycetota bacterium]
MTCPTGKRPYDTRAEARATRKQPPGPARRACLCVHCRHWRLGRLGRAAKRDITTKETA